MLDETSKLEAEVQSVAQIVADDSADALPDLAGLRAVVEDAPIVKFVNLVILQAVQERASDIHVEPTEHDLRIRFRIDGVLHERMRQPRSIVAGVVSRLKVMAEIDIAERRVPQDGRMSLSVEGKAVDLRVSTLPTVHGEKVVMRILDRASGVLPLADLGFLPEQLARYEMAYRQALRRHPRDRTDRLGQVDDAVRHPEPAQRQLAEHRHRRGPGRVPAAEHQPGADQRRRRASRSPTRCARSCARTPTSCSSGEIRDRETGVIAIEAALTGHLVLSTLHTNDAPSTPLRLLEMGIEPFLVTSALDCVLAQRLARRLCERCKELAPAHRRRAPRGRLGHVEAGRGPPPTLFRAVGCPPCGGTGYRGRLAVHEVMLMTEEIERLIVARASSDEIRRVAVAQGMIDPPPGRPGQGRPRAAPRSRRCPVSSPDLLHRAASRPSRTTHRTRTCQGDRTMALTTDNPDVA